MGDTNILDPLRDFCWKLEAFDINVTTKRPERQHLIVDLCKQFNIYMETVDIDAIKECFIDLFNGGHFGLFRSYYIKMSEYVNSLMCGDYKAPDIRRLVYDTIDDVFGLVLYFNEHNISIERDYA